MTTPEEEGIADPIGDAERIHNLTVALRRERELRADDRKGFERNLADVERRLVAVRSCLSTANDGVDGFRDDIRGLRAFGSVTVSAADLVPRADHLAALVHAVHEALVAAFPRALGTPASAPTFVPTHPVGVTVRLTDETAYRAKRSEAFEHFLPYVGKVGMVASAAPGLNGYEEIGIVFGQGLAPIESLAQLFCRAP